LASSVAGLLISTALACSIMEVGRISAALRTVIESGQDFQTCLPYLLKEVIGSTSTALIVMNRNMYTFNGRDLFANSGSSQ